jgi:hypothetical protein
MKKIYQTPETKMVKLANESLLIVASGTEAASGTEGDAREGGLVWELEEVTEEE